MSNAVILDHPEEDSAPATLSVGKVTLSAFRNYADMQMSFDAAPVVLTGANGSGKTNLLEAISLLVPGRGLRKAAILDLQNQNAAQPWAVACDIRTPFGPMTIGTGRDPQEVDGERRLVHIDGKNARSQNILAEHVAMAWVTPDMDRILAEGPSARRKLLDRLAYSFDPAHSGRVHRYEKAMRERLRLLREGIADAAWLNALEDEMAQTGVAIAAARRHLIRQLRTAIAETSSAFPRADLALKGMAEEALEDQPALPVEDKIRSALARARGDDAQSGTTSHGVHRTDLAVRHRAKDCPADLCSTGEQKALLIAIMLAYMRTLMQTRSMAPLFLLDDIAAHLDDIRRDALFEEILALGVQAWITGTDAEPFMNFLPHAQHGLVEQGLLRWA
ncbi:MAG TPA: DNA replication/repair protein RecF [Alphaproteobacteria bacterium]|nr:DNA replication/repair protein RecF [Alphaproteobacteria bacterium]